VRQPLGVDTAIFHPSRRSKEVRGQLNLTSSQRLLVYAGRFAREKNLPTLIEVAQQLGDDYHLLLIGGRRRESVGSNVTIWPYQRNSEMLATLIASGDLFVHAGENETFGLVLAEAMACGIPVVGVRSGGVPEVASDEVGALVTRATTLELCAAIQSVFERDTAQLGQVARQRAEQEFGWDAIFSSLLTAYSRLIDAKGSARVAQARAAAWQPQ
jgi:alpha-1,6-mannosyltransferase